MTRTISGKTQVLLGSHHNLNRDGMPTNVEHLTYSNNTKFYLENGYTVIGEATIEVTIIEKHEIIENKIESLRAEAKAIQAEATMKSTRIEQKIRDLLSIGFEGGITVEEDMPF